MNNVILIAYNGKKPSKAEIEKIADILMRMKFCGEVEIVKHYDQDSICDIVGKGATIVGFEPREDIALRNAATFINAHFSSPWPMFAEVANARNTSPAMRTKDQDALLSAVDIIGGVSTEKAAQYSIDPIMHNACYNVKYHILNID